jgi:rhodanese-related sulfurtransferase
MLVSPSDFIAKAKATIKECSVRDVHDSLHSGTLLVDIREPAEFMRGHIPGAILIPRGLLEFELVKHLEQSASRDAPEEADIVLYCGTGGRSALAAKSLDDMGFNNVRSMDGGIVAWAEAKFPLDLPRS